uniref:Conotoxin SI.13 n=1 Tax=Conus textile TaxID=6494 RepID=M313_CONTE|nr:RecName: Full=Conotoxin SI.13 [Conus textile]
GCCGVPSCMAGCRPCC